jgi:hypothetical protein
MTTFPVAHWHHEGHNGQVFQTIDIARLGGEEMVGGYVARLCGKSARM